MVYYIIAGIIIFIIGFILGKIPKKINPVGTLRIDHSEPDEAPLLFLELSTDPRIFMCEKIVTLNVNTESYLSQK